MTDVYNTLDHLLEPLELTQEGAQLYVEDIHNKPTEQLQDDYMMIWHMMPRQGYGDLKPLITQVRLMIISELRTRPQPAPRPRLCLRVTHRFEPDTVPTKHLSYTHVV